MLMVIFGAGASYDSASAFRPDVVSATWRPPLANQLFDLRRFGNYIAQFPKCQPLITHLQAPEVNVERVLEKYQNEASQDPERIRQLAAIRYYLQTMLSVCMVGWAGETNGVTNYKTLLDQIRHERTPGDKVCLVTFNYDTLLEDAASAVGFKNSSISDYISGDYQIIKLHGSINWGHGVTPFRNVANQNPQQIVLEVIEKAPELKFSGGYQVIPSNPLNQMHVDTPLFPALSIPVENKPGYECPEEHLRTLEEHLPRVAKVLVIGWRAVEDPFLKLLAQKMGKAAYIMVVSSSEGKAHEVIARIRSAGVLADQFLAAKGGFSQTILSGEAESFLKR